MTTLQEYDGAYARNTTNDFYQVLGSANAVGRYFDGYQNKWNWANIYAHVHNMAEYKDYTARTFCVSAERINYTPIDFEEIKAKMESVDFGR